MAPHYTHPVLDRLSTRLMAYSMAAWDTEWLIQSERELTQMQPATNLEAIDRTFWLTQVRQELARRDA